MIYSHIWYNKNSRINGMNLWHFPFFTSSVSLEISKVGLVNSTSSKEFCRLFKIWWFANFSAFTSIFRLQIRVCQLCLADSFQLNKLIEKKNTYLIRKWVFGLPDTVMLELLIKTSSNVKSEFQNYFSSCSSKDWLSKTIQLYYEGSCKSFC